jgi:hypothetical protein
MPPFDARLDGLIQATMLEAWPAQGTGRMAATKETPASRIDLGEDCCRPQADLAFAEHRLTLGLRNDPRRSPQYGHLRGSVAIADSMHEACIQADLTAAADLDSLQIA